MCKTITSWYHTYAIYENHECLELPLESNVWVYDAPEYNFKVLMYKSAKYMKERCLAVKSLLQIISRISLDVYLSLKASFKSIIGDIFQKVF